MTRRVLTAEEIFICDDLPREWVSTPEWRPPSSNGDECGVYVTTLPVAEKEKWEAEIFSGSGDAKADKIGLVIATALSIACVNENGERIFSPDHFAKLAKKSSIPSLRLWRVFKRLNAVTDADVSELVKN